MKIERTENTISVSAPYSDDFVAGARMLKGRWAEKAWNFPVALESEVMSLVRECYGYIEGNSETVTLIVIVNDEISERKGPVKLGPYILASARGRDGGAFPGPNVAKTSGTIKSGGSRANWESIVVAGTTFKILDVPVSVYESIMETHKNQKVTTGYTPYDGVIRECRKCDQFVNTYWPLKPEEDGRPDGVIARKLENDLTSYQWVTRNQVELFTITTV